MGRSSQLAGSNFETEAARLLRDCGCKWVVNWNDFQIPESKRPGDLQACLDGLSILCECKTTKAASISYNVIGDTKFYDEEAGESKGKNNQRRSLLKHALAGGLSLVAVKRRLKNKSRVWLIPFQHWEHFRRREKRKSLQLPDGKRPISQPEMGRFFVQDIFSTKDLKEFINQLFEDAKTLPLIDYRYH